MIDNTAILLVGQLPLICTLAPSGRKTGLDDQAPDAAPPTLPVTALDENQQGSGVGEDEIGGLLGDHDYWRVGVSAGVFRHDGRVDHP